MKYVIVSLYGNARRFSVRVKGNVLNKADDERTIEIMAARLSASDFKKWLKEKYSDYALIVLCVWGDVEVIKAQEDVNKNTPRYIDAEVLKNRISYHDYTTDTYRKSTPDEMKHEANVTLETLLGWIDGCPQADVAPVVHAHLVVERYCSHCDCDIHDYDMYSKLPKYCPECGAKMDEVVEDAKVH